jgi:hypothetical protein
MISITHQILIWQYYRKYFGFTAVPELCNMIGLFLLSNSRGALLCLEDDVLHQELLHLGGQLVLAGSLISEGE